MSEVRRRHYRGHLVGLARVESSAPLISAGDLTAVAPRHAWSLLMANSREIYVDRQRFLSLGVVRRWPDDLERRGHTSVATGLRELVAWADETVRVLRTEARHR